MTAKRAREVRLAKAHIKIYNSKQYQELHIRWFLLWDKYEDPTLSLEDRKAVEDEWFLVSKKLRNMLNYE